jgi:mRNA-degrading endonuclease toxin of MazEF toxin-antitoxin module
VLRGDIYEVDFGVGTGREVSGLLPAVLVSSDIHNVGPVSLIVLPGVPVASFTSRTLAVPAAATESGLAADTTFLCLFIRGVTPSRVGTRLLGRLPTARMADIDHILRSILDLRPPPPPSRRVAPRP